MPSVEYQTLVQSVADLKAELMNFPQSPTAPYSTGDLLKCQAFVVFSHAEMQVYWEKVARRILREAETRWKAGQKADRVIAALVAFRSKKLGVVPVDPMKPPDGGDLDKIIQEAIKLQTEAIDNNNGIKRANISNLLVPLGLRSAEFVEAMFIQLDQTGQKRGDIVHKSNRVSLRNIRDPFSGEMNDIDNLVQEIGSFDAKLEFLGFLSTPQIQPASSSNP